MLLSRRTCTQLTSEARTKAVTDHHRVDLDRLDTLVARLNGLAGYVHEHLEELDRRVAAIHSDGSWDGLAAKAHEQAHRQWADAAREFQQGVADMSSAAKTAHTAYHGAIDTNRSMLDG